MSIFWIKGYVKFRRRIYETDRSYSGKKRVVGNPGKFGQWAKMQLWAWVKELKCFLYVLVTYAEWGSQRLSDFSNQTIELYFLGKPFNSLPSATLCSSSANFNFHPTSHRWTRGPPEGNLWLLPVWLVMAAYIWVRAREVEACGGSACAGDQVSVMTYSEAGLTVSSPSGHRSRPI